MATKMATKKAKDEAAGKRQEATVDGAAEADVQETGPGEWNMAITPNASELVSLEVKSIKTEDQPRTSFQEPALLELSESFSTHGQLQPIVVLQRKNDYLLIAGERRLRAARNLGFAFIRAMVYRDLTDRQAAEMQLAENFQRRDLNHMETARALGKLRDAGASAPEIGKQVHKSADYVREHLDLLRLAEPVQEHVASGRLPIKQAAMIARVGDEAAQKEIATATIGDGSYGAKIHDTVLPMHRVRDLIRYRLKTLGSCGWPMDEPYARKQPCGGCVDNTATEAVAMLFEGINLPGKSKKGNCTNAACYAVKAKAWEKEPVKKARDKANAEKRKAKGLTPANKQDGEDSWDRKQREINELKAKFPWTAKQRMACALHRWGQDLAQVIGKAIVDPVDLTAETPLLVLWAQSKGGSRRGRLADRRMRVEDVLKGTVPGKEISRWWDAAIEWTRWKDEPGIGHDSAVRNVPLPMGHMTLLNDLQTIAEAVCISYSVPARPTAQSIAADALREKILKGNKAASLKAIAECWDGALLNAILSGEKKLAKYKAAAVTERIAHLAVVGEREEGRETADDDKAGTATTKAKGKAAGKRQEAIGKDDDVLPPLMPEGEDQPASGVCKYCGCTEDKGCGPDHLSCSWADDEKTVCYACKSLVITIINHPRPVATVAIDGCTSAALLKACQDGFLQGDWRRAMVARRIEQIEKAVASSR